MMFGHFAVISLLMLAEFPTLHDHSDGRVRGARKIRFDRVLCDVPCSGVVAAGQMAKLSRFSVRVSRARLFAGEGDGRLRRAPGSWPRWHARYMLQMHYVAPPALICFSCTLLRNGSNL